MAIRRIGQIFVDLGFIKEDQLEALLVEQENRGGELLGQVALSQQLIREEQLAQALAEQMGMPVVDLGETVIPMEVLGKVTETMAQMYRIIPVAFRDNTLTVAMCDPQNLRILDELRSFLGYEIRGVVATETDIKNTLQRYYAGTEDIGKQIEQMKNDPALLRAEQMMKAGKFDLTSAEELSDSAPVRKLLNMILLLAIKDQASDVHFEPFEHEFKIRVKADGVLYEMVPPPRHLAVALVTRIKVMASLDIAERRLPQDGRIELLIGNHPVDLRVSVLPTLFGESVVVRVLDRSVVNLDLNVVGMDATILRQYREVLERPNGIILVTGPTGSGKTTTLYSSLVEMNEITDKIITTEDPVEYDIDGIIQVPIDHSIEVTFASCLRAILRQDPDVILVGEIRDTETAEIAIQAALTGHLVFSTLHTNDSPSTITRLRDMHIPPFLIAATVEAILAQRLLRRVCVNCRQEVPARAEVLADLKLKPEDLNGRSFYKGAGCETCNGTGYKGRIGIFELMHVNEVIREMIMQNASVDELREAAKGFGMTPLRDAAMKMVFDGVTTAEEVIRETVLD
ncbi:MAG TPA: ATPase, T2SS/T4P/T4SS family [Pirellulales bacterium]